MTSRLEELIAELCPNGVEYKKIGDIADVKTGKSNGNEAEEDGLYPFFVRSENIKRKNDWEYDEEAIIIPGEGGIGDIYHYIKGKYALHQRVYRVHFEEPIVNTRFAYYYFKSNFKRFIIRKAVSATVTSIRKPMIEDFEIPVPPLDVQSEIVQILDTFTELTAELTADLTAELTARKKQYEYYHDTLLTFDDNNPLHSLISRYCPNGVDKIKLNEICKIYDGTHSTPQYKESGVKFVSVENINDLYSTTKYISEEDFDKYKIKPQIGDVFMTRIGSIGICNVVDRDEKLAYYVSLALLRPNTAIINSRYLKYAIESIHGRKELRKRTLVNAVPIKINKDDIGKVQLPVPPLEVQREIVRILDNFTELTSEFTENLTSELTARKKQYEYYRDQLLTFKRA